MSARNTLISLLALALLLPLTTLADAPPKEEYMTWEEFLEEYESAFSENEDAPQVQDSSSEYEEIYRHPFNINTVGRNELLLLPFATEAAVDSILAYRERKGGYFITLGELQFVSGLDYATRRRLSLFLYAGERPTKATPKKRSLWREGHHTLETLFGIPLYLRAGDVKHTAEQAEVRPNKYFEGYALANTTRYTYANGYQLRYGATLQKDAGEPFGTKGSQTYPFDYTSLHFYLRPNKSRYEVAAGDYRVRLGQGLLVGNGNRGSRVSMISALPSAEARITPHTGTEESRFFRGVAGSYTFALSPHLSARALGFMSYRLLDGTLTAGDTITAFKTDGLHRTLTELRRRHTVDNLTGGMHLSLSGREWRVGLSGVWSHYGKTIYPALRTYNIYYMRGRDAAGLSADYQWQRGRWQVQGEVAMDKGAHFATTHSVHWRKGSSWAWYAQVRAMAPEFVSPWGSALSQNSHLQNEIAVLAGGRWRPSNIFDLEAYAEYFHWPNPAYRISKQSDGLEAYLQGGWHLHRYHCLRLRYRFKTREYDVTGYDLTQFTGIHHLRTEWQAKWKRVALTVDADGSLYATQTAPMKFGAMLSARASWVAWQPLSYKPHEETVRRLRLQAFAAVFSADSYDARLYTFRPRLLWAGGFSSFFYKGCAASLVAEYRPLKWLELGLQYDLLHYFNRDKVGSGLTEVNAPTRNDISLQARLVF